MIGHMSTGLAIIDALLLMFGGPAAFPAIAVMGMVWN